MNSTANDNSQDTGSFAHRLLDWYAQHARKMPWRIPPDQHAVGVRAEPYHVWLSEVMLQQTQVKTVIDYFQKFVTLWPTVHDLASADLDDVLKAWAGLGYYSRARNLKKCADQVVADFGGKFPSDAATLKTLPGIGDYTAAAIASIAFDEPAAVVDGNIERVMARHHQIETPFPKAKPEVKQHLLEIMDRQKPGEFAQAMMDLGATLCTPKRPACSLCPVNEDCNAFKCGDAQSYPRKLPKKTKPTRKGAAFIITNDKEEIFLCKRPNQGLLAGMTQVPTTDWNSNKDGATGIDSTPFDAEWQQKGTARHTFTHFHLELEVWETLNANRTNMDGWWCHRSKLDGEAIPSLFRKVLQTV